MPTANITWITNTDGKQCRKCAALNGYEWTFTEEVPAVLIHPNLGVVWNLLSDTSQAHGVAKFNCRCTLLIEFDDSDLVMALDDLERETETLNITLIDGVDAAEQLSWMLRDFM